MCNREEGDLHDENDAYKGNKSEMSRLQLRREERSQIVSYREVPTMAVQDGKTSGKGCKHRCEELKTKKSR